MPAMESSMDDYGVQSLRDSMLASERREREPEAELDSDQDMDGSESRTSELLGNSFDDSLVHQVGHKEQDQPHREPHRSRKDSELSSSSGSGTVLASNRQIKVPMDLSGLDPSVFPAIVDDVRDRPDEGDTGGQKEEEKHGGPKEPKVVRRSSVRTPPRSISHTQGSSSSPPYYQPDDKSPPRHSPTRPPHRPSANAAPTADMATATATATGTGTTYPSPNSSTFSIHSSFISVSSLSRGSSPFEGWSAGESEPELEGSPDPGLRAGAARDNEEEVSLVLPDPGSVVRPGRRGTRDTMTPITAKSTLPPFPASGKTSRGKERGREGVLDIALIGRGGSTRAFVRALGECPEVRCFRARGAGGGVVHPDMTFEAALRRPGVVVLVFEATERDGDGEEAETEERTGRLLARLSVFDHEYASVDTLEQTLQAIQASYTRLNRLLRQDPDPSSSSGFERDTSRLVASWIESGKRKQDNSRVGTEEETDVWFDFVIITGERRDLLDRDYETLVRLMSVAPAVCWPSELEEGLARHLPLPFFRLKATEASGRLQGGPPDPTPRCQANSNRIDSYFARPLDMSTTDNVVQGLVDLLTMDPISRPSDRQTLSRHNLESVSVQHFMAWQRGLAFSGPGLAAHHPRAVDSGVEEPSPERSPSATMRPLYNHEKSHSSAPNEWEAGLSRRHAQRKRNDQKQYKKRGVARPRKGRATSPNVFEDAASSASDETICTPRHPVRRAVAAVLDSWRSAADDTRVKIREPWKWIGWTCFGLAAGLGCVVLAKGWKDGSLRL